MLRKSKTQCKVVKMEAPDAELQAKQDANKTKEASEDDEHTRASLDKWPDDSKSCSASYWQLGQASLGKPGQVWASGLAMGNPDLQAIGR